MNRASLCKQAADAGALDTGAYIEWLEALIEALGDEPADEEARLP